MNTGEETTQERVSRIIFEGYEHSPDKTAYNTEVPARKLAEEIDGLKDRCARLQSERDQMTKERDAARAEIDSARTQTRLLATSARRALRLRWKPAWPAVEHPETINARWDLLEKVRLVIGEEE